MIFSTNSSLCKSEPKFASDNGGKLGYVLKTYKHNFEAVSFSTCYTQFSREESRIYFIREATGPGSSREDAKLICLYSNKYSVQL